MRNSVQGIILLLVYGVIIAVQDEVSVIEGDSVTLHTDTVIKNDDKIYWRFGKTGAASRLVQMIEYKVTYEDSIDGRFRYRLQISDTQTGDLTIKNMRIKFSGLYEAEIDSDTGTSYKRFNVTVKESPRVTDAGPSDVKSVSVTEGESVTLHTDVQTQKGDLILWRFGDENVLIAKGDMEDNKISVYDDDDDGGFSGRLKLDESGDLTITNIRISNTGVYKLKIISSRETKYKTFSVSVSGAGFSSGAVAGLCVGFLLVIAAGIAVGVILYLRMKQTVKMMSVPEGDPLALPGSHSELQTGTQIEWKFNGHVIMTGEMKEDGVISVIRRDDQPFKDRLNFNPYFGHLIIEPILKEDTGLYEVKITNKKETTHNKTHVNVIVEMVVSEGDTLALPSADRELQTGTQIVWMFSDRVIMTGEMKENKGICVINRNDPQFKGRLTFNDNNQSLYISNISKEDTGLYEVKITNNKQTTYFRFSVDLIAGYMAPFKGDSVHLQGAKNVLQMGAQIVWKFNGRVIMTGEMTKDKGVCEIYNDDPHFNGRLELGDHIGYLIIKPILSEDTGLYEVKITNNEETSHNKFQVNVIGKDFVNHLIDDESAVSTEEDVNEQTRDPVKTVYDVVNMVEEDSARTYRNDPAVDIPLLEKV